MTAKNPTAALAATLTLAGVLAVLALPRRSPAVAELPPAYELLPLPADVDSATSLRALEQALIRCEGECATVVYAWTPRMPLSRAGIPEVREAAQRLGVRLALVAYEALADYSVGDETGSVSLADGMLAAGVLAHAPALVVVRRGRPVGPAVLGYKREAAYEAAIARRLSRAFEQRASGGGAASTRQGGIDPSTAVPAPAPLLADFDAVGLPGAYFRWVPGRQALAYESGQRVYLLDLADGESRLAPGFIDFVPTPDGRFFVTPGEVGGGLTFYDADEVFEAVRAERPGTVEPIFTDLRMRDQYPSVGILEQDSTRTLYRVMTSWFEGVIYRDYDVRVDRPSRVSSVQPVGEPVRPCSGVALSTPIMSQDGLEVAGRDEASGTTKIFRILDGGRCETAADLGVPTSKVAWHPTGRKLAFSIPRRRAGDGSERGIFVLDRDRDGGDLIRLPASEDASRLAFPDFVGDAAVVYLVPGTSLQQPSVFRLVTLAP